MAIFSNKKKLKILFVSTEAEPFVVVGGLGAVMFALPRALRKIGHDARVMIPRYLSIQDEHHNLKTEYEGLNVPTDNKKGAPFLVANVKKYSPKNESKDPVITYFLENQEYYETRANVYGYADDPVRWALLSRGVLEFLKVSDWMPDVIVTSDWQIGYLSNYLKTVYKDDPKLNKIATVFSIHNLSYQGAFRPKFVSEMDSDDGHSAIPAFEDERLLMINGMRRGIMYSDQINTVSETYAREIMTKEYGEGLDDLLQERRSVVHGILNGLDYSRWNPEEDPVVEHHFSADHMDPRSENKKVLQNRFGLNTDPDSFLLGIVTRMSSQKGMDLLQPVIKKLLEELNLQMVVVGEGDTNTMTFFQDLNREFPKQVGLNLKFDASLAHLIFAGADSTVIPSKFEPSGLTQLEAMRYGTIPIVRKTGGLADTVQDYSATTRVGDGFVFEKFDSFSLMIAIVRAYEEFQSKSTWAAMQKRVMKKDFSWERSAQQYEKLFIKAANQTRKK